MTLAILMKSRATENERGVGWQCRLSSDDASFHRGRPVGRKSDCAKTGRSKIFVPKMEYNQLFVLI